MRRSLAVSLAAAFVVLAACDSSVETKAVDTAAPVTEAPTTTARPTTTKASTTTSTSTTLPATTTTVTLPIPQAPPEPRAQEPVVELGQIDIPKLGVSKTLYEGVSLTTLDRGPGHWPGTALPGQYGNVVIGGHRTSHDKPFRNIDQLAPGDSVILTTPQGTYDYKVTGTQIVTPDDIWIVDQKPGYFLTLFACHPVGSTRERIIVFLQLAGT